MPEIISSFGPTVGILIAILSFLFLFSTKADFTELKMMQKETKTELLAVLNRYIDQDNVLYGKSTILEADVKRLQDKAAS